MKLISATASLFMLFFAASEASAQCDVQVEVPAQVRFTGEDSGGYDSYDTANFASDFTVRIHNQDTAKPCSMLLSIQRDIGTQLLENGTGGALNYELLDSRNRNNIVDTETLSGRPPRALEINLRPGERTERRFNFYIPPRQTVPSGDYSDTVLVRAFDAVDAEIISDETIRLQTKVKSQTAIFLSDARAPGSSIMENSRRPGQIDFGELQTNETQSIGLLVVSNDSYTIRVESENNGALVHDRSSRADMIDYQAYFASRPVDLSGGTALLGGFPSTAVGGSNSILQIIIGEVGKARAGRYQDRLTLTVLPDR